VTISKQEARTYRATLARLGGAQKSARGAPAYVRWVNRRLGRYFAAWAYLRGMTPNQVTAVSNVFTFAAIVSIAVFRPSWPEAVILVLALLVGYAIDSADGQVARLRGGGSPAGEWLDHVADAGKVTAIHLAVAICWFRFYDLDHAAYLLIPLAYVFVSAVFFFGVIATEMLRRIVAGTSRALGRGAATADTPLPAPALRSFIVLPADFGMLCLTFLLLPLHTAFGVMYSLLLVANSFFLLGALFNWFRELRRLAW